MTEIYLIKMADGGVFYTPNFQQAQIQFALAMGLWEVFGGSRPVMVVRFED